MKQFAESIVQLALSLALATVVLTWSWGALRPLAVPLVIVVVVIGTTTWLVHRRRHW